MTITTDLRGSIGKYRNIFIKIDGINAVFWREHALGKIVPQSSATVYSCLESVDTGEIGISWQEMATQLSAISFKLIDFVDANNQYVISKLFAPGSWYSGTHTSLKEGTASREQLDADATTIPCDDTTGFAASGLAYLGKETFDYCGVGATSFTGVTRGVYPSISGAASAYTFQKPLSEDSMQKVGISTNPRTLFGRRVCVYVTTWDDATASWLDNDTQLGQTDSPYLFFCGRITDSVNYANGVWTIACESIFRDLEAPINKNSAEQVGITSGVFIPEIGRKFNIKVTFNDIVWGWMTVDALPSGEFRGSIFDLMNRINYAINTTGWTLNDTVWIGFNRVFDNCSNYDSDLDVYDPGAFGWINFCMADDGKINFYMMFPRNTADMAYVIQSLPGEYSHVLAAMGFEQCTKIVVDNTKGETADDRNNIFEFPGKVKAFHSYYPCEARIDIEPYDINWFWDNQGDYSSSAAFIKMTGYRSNIYDTESDNKCAYFCYKSRYNTYLRDVYFYHKPGGGSAGHSFCGSQDRNNPIKITQVYIPNYKKGIFESLLYPLLSTGTTDYNNSTYDKLPIELSVGIPDEIVDINSFLYADYVIGASSKSIRQFYEVKNESFLEIIKRELILYGYVLTWSNSKLTLKKFSPPEIHSYVANIDNTNIIGQPQMAVNFNLNSVINSYECKLDYDVNTEKYYRTVIVNDANSVSAFGLLNQIKFEHPGITSAYVKDIRSFLMTQFANRFCSSPMGKVTITLPHIYIDQISAGDVVYFSSDYVPNLNGDGTLSTQVYAIVENISWNLETWLGECDLVLMPDSGYYVKFGPSAAVSSWDAVNYRFTLSNHEFSEAGDADDGSRFKAGDAILVICRSPSNPSSLDSDEVYGPLTVASDYETDGAGLLSISGTPTLTDWDTNKEYIITYADYADTQTSQKTAAFLADGTTELIATGVYGKRWQ